MDLIYQIERVAIKRTEKNYYIVIYGYAFDKNKKEITFDLCVNGKSVGFIQNQLARHDVYAKYERYHPNNKCGFRLQVKLTNTEDLRLVQLRILIDSISKEIFHLNEKNINSFVDDNDIDYYVDGMIFNNKNELNCNVRGYAFSLESSEMIQVIIKNDKNQMVECSVLPYNRDDLFNAGIVNDGQKYCGFDVKFSVEKGQKYFLILRDDKGEQIIKLKTEREILYKGCKGILYLQKFVNGLRYLKRYGLNALLKRLKNGANPFGCSYEEWYLTNRADEKELKIQRDTKFDFQPLISVIVPTYNTPLHFLREMIESVRSQSYSNFELCIADGSTDNNVIEEIKKYSKLDSRIKYTLLDKNYGIAGNTNKALEIATGDYVGLFDHDDLLTPDCLFEIVKSLQEKRHDIIYTDEDKTDSKGKKFMDPNFKPDWNVDLFYSHNYITHFFVVKTEIIKGVGGFRSECDGAQDYDVMFRCIEKADSIYHIPKILYHWRMHAASTAENPASKMYCYEAGKKAIEDHYFRTGIKAKVEIMDLWGMYHTIYDTSANPLISIIIPNKDQVDTLRTCINSLYNINKYQNFEIIIVENNSTEEFTFEFYKELEESHNNIKVVYWENEFNYSAINNYGAKFANGDYYLLLNNDTEAINKEAISEMLGVCMRDDVGIVGAKLLYHDDTVQHAGIVIGFGGFAGHIFTGIGKDDYGYMVRARINCDYSAVTAACLMVKKSVFEEVNGLSEEFKVGLNDVDFCLKVRETGKLVVFNAFSLWHHYESKSRGYEDTLEKVKRFENEIKLFQNRWNKILSEGDPYYNKNFPVEYGPFKLG